MIVRTKSGEFSAGSSSALLDFLGIRKGAAGLQNVATDAVLVAAVPFYLATDGEIGHEGSVLSDGIAWTLSTFDIDRYGERVDPQGWDFKRYMANPVVQWAHRYDIPAIGKIEGLAVDGDGLHGVVRFNDKSFDPFGWSIGERVKAGVIRAGSVGFRVMEIELPSKADSRDGTQLIFRKQELLEFSICNVPANPFALAKMSNEQLAGSNGIGSNAANFWAGFMNNL
ncbi:MAG: HK97 family phage prohead protease [Treponema sp.]|nr:HK97 family phage prohead protease [Treponema sp.]